jgi:zinc protease
MLIADGNRISPLARPCRPRESPGSKQERPLNIAPWRVAVLAMSLVGLVVTTTPRISLAGSDDSLVQAAAALYKGVRVETLDNGLRVYLKPVPNASTVTVKMAYRVGSADEDLDFTGLAHYLEHLLFKGTEKLLPGDIDRQTLRNGGGNNAYTNEDMTVYHFDFAADRWEIALDIEADRMRNTKIDAKHEFDKEKRVVVEELARNEDGPWDLEFKAILPLLFGEKAPYGHPVIGQAKHVHAATPEVITGFYDKWYHPNNAALVICGGFDPDAAMEKIKKKFGSIPRKELPARKTYTPVKRKGPVHFEFESKFELPRMVMGFNTVAAGEQDAYALDVLAAVLASGKTSRFYRKFVEGDQIANYAGADHSAGRYPGWFSVMLELLPGHDPKQAEAAVLAEIKKVQDALVPEAELKRVRRNLLASAIFNRVSVHNLADSIARGVTLKDLAYLENYLPNLDKVTAKEIQEVARKYLDPTQRVVVWSLPKGMKGGGEKVGPPSAPRRRELRQKEAPSRGEAGFSLQAAHREVLDNGMTLLLLEDHRLPVVYVEASLRTSARKLQTADKAGLASLMGSLLDEGTANRTGQQIAQAIEDVGGSLSMGAGGGSVKVLKPDLDLGLELFFDCLTRPAFPKDAFERLQKQQLADIADSELQPDERASTVYAEMIYGKHPYGLNANGTIKSVEQLTPEDCKALHQKLFVPNNVILAVVGDFDRKDMIARIKKATVDWKKKDLPKVELPAVTKPAKFTEKIVTMPEAAQLYFYMGHVGIRRDDPDYYKLLVMDYVLGVGPGFTDRLSAKLRDRLGLAYTVRASITASAGDEPGTFTCFIGTRPEEYERVKKLFLEEIEDIRFKPASAEEVEDAKKFLLGNLPFRFINHEGVAGMLLQIERHGLGLDYVDKYKKAVAAVTPEDVLAAAKKHLDPARMIVVAAGAIDQNGKALSPPKE